MEGFSLTCSSCKAKLRVRDRSLVGQVVDCPKCASPILVKPLGDVRPGREDEITVTDSMAIPDEPVDRKSQPPMLGGAFDEIDALLSASAEPPPPMPRGAGPAQAANPSVTLAKGATPKAAAPKPASPKSAAVPKEQKPTSGSKSGASSGTIPAPPVAASPATIVGMSPPASAAPAGTADEPPERPSYPKRSPYVLLAVSLTGGVVLTLVVALGLSYFLRASKSDKTIAQANANTPPSANGQEVTGKEGGPGAPPDESPAAEANPAAGPTEKPAEEMTTEEPATPDPSAEAIPQDPEKPSEKPSSDEPKSDDPLGIATAPAVEPKELPAAANSPKKAVPVPGVPSNALSEFGKLLGEDIPEDAAIAPPPMPPVSDKPPMEGAVAKPAEVEVAPQPILPRPVPRKVDVAARLADPLPGLELEDAPLADVLQVLSDLTTIPITLDPDLLPYSKISPTTKITSKQTKTTVGQALDSILKPLNLTAIVVDQQLVVRPIDDKPETLQSKSIPWGDLTGNNEQDSIALADMLSKLVDADGWQVGEEVMGPTLASAKDSLAVHASYGSYARLFTICEKLRVARHLPVKSKFPPALFDLTPRSDAVAAKLSTTVSLNFSQPTHFVKILSRLEAASKLRILVDWQSLAEAGWTPDGEGQLVVENESVKSALKKLLDPMELAFRAVDSETLQVVSRQSLGQRLEVEIYPANKLVKKAEDGPAIVARAEAAFPEGVLDTTGGKGHIAWDPKSMSILASLAQPDQQQLASLLSEWSKPAEADAPDAETAAK